MKKDVKELLISNVKRYFGDIELPVVFYYTDSVSDNEIADTRHPDRCLIANLNSVREGKTFVYSARSAGCPGGMRYTGFTQKLRSDFNYFLSCGIPGKVTGERYKKTPELVREYLKNTPAFTAPAKYLVFKRWDALEEKDDPAAAIFFATPDVLSGLFTLANYDSADLNAVIAPMGSGCSSIIAHPLREAQNDRPRCVLGMFDVSARTYVPENTLTFTVPIKRLETMLQNMSESFFITESWKAVNARINK
jgi:uncharacterized protein (DUF169 family)